MRCCARPGCLRQLLPSPLSAPLLEFHIKGLGSWGNRYHWIRDAETRYVLAVDAQAGRRESLPAEVSDAGTIALSA